MPVRNVPEELVELRQSLRDFIDREVRPAEEAHRQETQRRLAEMNEKLKDL